MALLRMVTRHGDGCARCKRSACSCDDNGGDSEAARRGCRRCRGQLGAVLESVLVVLVLVAVVAPVRKLGAVLESVLVVLVVLVPVLGFCSCTAVRSSSSTSIGIGTSCTTTGTSSSPCTGSTAVRSSTGIGTSCTSGGTSCSPCTEVRT
jgi:hypothetical protein